VSAAQALRDRFFQENLRDLNRLVYAAEALEAPELPDVPPWGKSPADPNTLDSADPEELRALAVEWMDWASKLDDILGELSFEELGEALERLHAKATAAREALVRLDAYDPPAPGSP
jgi:hypothetical protein